MRKVRFALASLSFLFALLLFAVPALAQADDAAAPAETAQAAAEAPAGVTPGVDEAPEAAGEEDEAAAEPEKIVRRSFAARWERPIRYREMRTLFRKDKPETIERRIWWRPPDRLRVEEEDGRGRRVFLWNERGQWFFDSRFPYLLHIRVSRPGLPLERLPFDDEGAPRRPSPSREEWSKRELTGPGGRRMHVIEWCRPGGCSRWWIDRENSFPWMEEHFGPDGEPAALIIRTDVELDAALGDDVFEFEVPEGVEVLTNAQEWRQRVIVYGVRSEAPFPAALPTYLPAGYVLVGGRVIEINGLPAVHWQFFNGATVLSMFQLPEDGLFRPRPGGPIILRQGEATVVSVVRNGHRFFVVGDVNVGEAQRMLVSLEDL